MSEYLLEIKNLKKSFPLKTGKNSLFGKTSRMCAVDNMSLSIKKGETYGLVGESGCGKSTTGRAIVGLTKPDSGSILYDGKDLCKLSDKEFKPLRKELQMVFQNTLSALNPRQRIGNILEDILKIHSNLDAAERREKVVEVLKKVGLSEDHYFRFPHELSGGQVQRLGIASALVIGPKLIVCDEPVSALDVSIQAQILNLMMDLQEERKLTYMFITHDLSVVKHISDDIAVMYLGRIVEIAEKNELYNNPQHPYTKALLSAIPIPDVDNKMKREILTGDVPSPLNPPSGCYFHTRCKYATERCKTECPALHDVGNGHMVACHLT